MSHGLLLLAAGYALLAVLVGWLVADRRAPLAPKLAALVAAPWLAFAVWQAVQPPSGWPATGAPPAGSRLEWGKVREPDALSGDRGEIDLWATPAGAARPRAYRLPYSRPLHQQLQAALAALRAGRTLDVARPGHGRPGRGHARHGQRGAQGQRGGAWFYPEPPPRLPAKR